MKEDQLLTRGDGSEPGQDGDGFPQRLQRLIGRSSIRGFARKAGVSDTFLRQCLAGRTEPTRTKLLLLARAGGCNVEWLATGRDPAHEIRDEQPLAHPVDPSLLQEVIETVEEVISEHGRTLTPGRKAAIISAIYERQSGTPHPSMSREDIAALIRQSG